MSILDCAAPRRAFAAVAVLLAVVLLAAAHPVAAVSSMTTDNCASVTADPLSTADFTSAALLACTAERCLTTIGEVITDSADGYCNGDATLEAAVDCATLATAYSTFYACVQRALRDGTSISASYQSELALYFNTPGVPYTLTNLPCYACNHFKNDFLASSGSSCTTLTCLQCCGGQSPASTTRGNPGKGYNAVLCGNGCITALMMIPFTFVSFFIFICCCCSWPSPSLKSTAARAKAEEEAAERALRHPNGSDEGKPNEEEEEEEEEENRRAAGSHSSGHRSGNKSSDKDEEEQEEREPFNEVTKKEEEKNDLKEL